MKTRQRVSISSPQLVAVASAAGCSPQTIRRAYCGARVNAYNLARIVEAARALHLPIPPAAKGAAA